jgi:hypothetical protein
MEEIQDDMHCLQLVVELCKDCSGVASTFDNVGTERVGAPCETKPFQ